MDDDDRLKQLEMLGQIPGPVGNDSDFVPRSYEEAVAERAERRRQALEDRRNEMEQQSKPVKQRYIQSTEESFKAANSRTGGRPHDDHMDYTQKMSGAYYRKQAGVKGKSGAYYRKLKNLKK